MATRTQTTVANCAWNRMGRVAQPKPCILGLTLGSWRAHEFNRAASAVSRGYSGMLCEWSVGGPWPVFGRCVLQTGHHLLYTMYIMSNYKTIHHGSVVWHAVLALPSVLGLLQLAALVLGEWARRPLMTQA